MILFLIISFLLDLLLKYLYPSLSSIFLVSSLVLICLIYPKKKAYLLGIIFGIYYDLLFTNIGFINVYLIILIIMILDKLFTKLNINLLTIILSTVIIILFYDVMSYIILTLSSKITIDFNIFVTKSIIQVLVNTTYTVLSYLILDKYYIFKRQ